jgi:hypothetical protein
MVDTELLHVILMLILLEAHTWWLPILFSPYLELVARVVIDHSVVFLLGRRDVLYQVGS